jgi:hypothetical protein
VTEELGGAQHDYILWRVEEWVAVLWVEKRLGGPSPWSLALAAETENPRPRFIGRGQGLP